MTNTTQTKTFWLHEMRLPELKKVFEGVNKRAKRNNLPLNEYKIIETEQRTGKLGRIFNMLKIEAVTPVVRFGGWKFLAELDYTENPEKPFIRSLSFDEDSAPFAHLYNQECVCEHCETKRKRNKVFYLEHKSGEKKLVGSSCVKVFLKNATAKYFLENWDDVTEFIRDTETQKDDDECWDHFQKSYSYNLDTVLLLGFEIIKQDGGYVSPRVCASTATGHIAMDIIFNPAKAKNIHPRYILDREILAKRYGAQLEELKTFVANLEERSTYDHNIKLIFENETVSPRNITFAISAIAYLLGVKNQEAKKEEEKKNFNPIHFGEIGKKVTGMEGEITRMQNYQHGYGWGTIVHVKTAESLFVWFSSKPLPDSLDLGVKVALSGTIKKHDEFRGVKQTVITRAKLSQISA